MHGRGRGRGILGTWAQQDDALAGPQKFRAQQDIVNKPYRIVSLSSPPPRLPVTSRLGWIPVNTVPQQNGVGVDPASHLTQPTGPCVAKAKPRTPCKNVADNSSTSSEHAVLKAQPKPRSLKLISTEDDTVLANQTIQWMVKQGDQYVPDVIHEACIQVLDNVKEDFTNDDPMDCFSDASPTTESASQQSLDLTVSHLLDSIEEHTRRSTENEKRRDLEDGECDEPQDFPSRMVKYYRDMEAANTFVVANAISNCSDANQNCAKVPSPEQLESTRCLKQALEDIRRRTAESNQKPSQTASQVVEEKKVSKVTKIAPIKLNKTKSPPSQIPKKESEGCSTQQESSTTKQSYKLNPLHVAEDKKSTASNQAKTVHKSEDTEWRREVRIVEKRERSRDRHRSRETESRRLDRSTSRHRSRSPRRKHLRRSSPIRRDSRSRSIGRRRSRSRSPPYRRGRSPSRSSPYYPRRHRSRSPARNGSRSPIRRGPRSPIRRASSRSPCRRRSRDRSPVDGRATFERKVVVRKSRSPPPPVSRSQPSHSHSRSPTPGRNIREELLAIQNGTGAAVPSPSAVSQSTVSTTSAVTTVQSDVGPPAYSSLTGSAPVHATASYNSVPPVHPLMSPHLINLAGYYGQQAAASIGTQDQYGMQQIAQHQLMHQQTVVPRQLVLHHQMIQRQQLQEHLQQQFLQQLHHASRQLQQPTQQAPSDCSAIAPATNLSNINQTLITINPTSEHSSAVAAQKDELAMLEQRLRSQRDSKLEKQLKLIHQLLIVRFQQADSEQKQKIATTEVERERLSLNIMEKAKLEKEMASSAQALEKFIQRATTQLGEDLDEVKKERSNHLYRFYDPQQHWCELCDVICEKLHDYLNHLHSKEHEQRLESTGVPSTPWHNKQKPAETDKTTGKDGLIANRIPFGGLQCLQPVKAWYCEMCDVWMGDIHCAQLHMTSTQHNNSFLKRIMERPDSGFFNAVKKQAALKKNLARVSEEKARTSIGLANKRKMEQLEKLRARIKKKLDAVEKEAKEVDADQTELQEANQDATMELGQDDTSTENRQASSEPEAEKQTGVAESTSDGAFQKSANDVPGATVNGNEEFDSNAAPVAQVVSSEGCEEIPPGGRQAADLEPCSKSGSSPGALETREFLNVQVNVVDKVSGETFSADTVVHSRSESAADWQTSEGVPSAQFTPRISLLSKDGQDSSSGRNSTNNEPDMHANSRVESQRDISDPRVREDQNISRTPVKAIDDSAETTGPICSSSPRADAPENQETWHSVDPTPLQPLLSVRVKMEPEEMRPVKTERDLPASEGPVVLVKSEHHSTSIRAESSPAGSFGHLPEGSSVVIKKEREIKEENAAPGDCENVQRQTEGRHSSPFGTGNVSEQQDECGTDDCCIIDEVDPRSSRVLGVVDLEVNVVTPTPTTRRAKQDSTSSSLLFDHTDDAPDSELCVQLSDYIVLSETGEQDSTEVDH